MHPDWLLLLRCHGSPRVHTLSIIQWEHFKTMKVVFKSRGTSPSSSACPPGLHGPLCQLQCDCMNGASCHPASGRCVCPPGYLGARCHRVCDQGTFGHGCAKLCDCEEDSPCDPVRGRCLCSSGKTGPRCDIDCRENRFGPDCAQTCECGNGAQCDTRNGRCSCLHSWIGLSCQEGGPPPISYSRRGDSQHGNSL